MYLNIDHFQVIPISGGCMPPTTTRNYYFHELRQQPTAPNTNQPLNKTSNSNSESRHSNPRTQHRIPILSNYNVSSSMTIRFIGEKDCPTKENSFYGNPTVSNEEDGIRTIITGMIIEYHREQSVEQAFIL